MTSSSMKSTTLALSRPASSDINEAINRSAKALSVALHERDESTSAHCSRVVSLAVKLGERRGLSDPDLDLLRISAELHDIGKIEIPDSVLLKPGKPSEDEWAVLRSHPVISQRIVSAIDVPNAQAMTMGFVVRHHHERYDGGGYPDGLVGNAIPLLSRIIALADTYDTMASGRLYSKAMSHRQIMEVLSMERGHQHDASLFPDFCAIVEPSAC